MSYFEYTRATVINVVDGDTVDIKLDLGFKIYHIVRARLAGINAPELHSVYGPAAKDYLINLVSAEPSLTVRTFKLDKKDKYGRYVAELIGAHGSLNDEMIRAGHATPYSEKL